MHNEQSLSRTARIIEQLEEIWQRPHQPSPDTLKRITEFVASLPEEYRATGLEVIAQYAVDTMRLHILDMIAMFQQKAEQEGIEDRQETLDDILPETFRVLADLSKNIAVRSLDDLIVLTNVSISLQMLSRSYTAEQAQARLYRLATKYYRRLMKEGLIIDGQDHQGQIPDSATRYPLNYQ